MYYAAQLNGFHIVGWGPIKAFRKGHRAITSKIKNAQINAMIISLTSLHIYNMYLGGPLTNTWGMYLRVI